MKILIINKFFYKKGGAETYSFALRELLEANGHEVMDFSMDHKDNASSSYSMFFVKGINYHKKEVFYQQLNKGRKFLYSLEAARKLKTLITTERPDIVHLQNYRHQLTVSIIKTLIKEKIPIVHTIHDLQLLCGNYQMLSHGRLCEKCKNDRHYHCLLNKCVKDSKIYSFLAMFEMYLNRLLLNRKDWCYFIAPSTFFKQKFAEYGYPEDRIYVIPNFLEIKDYEPCYESEDYFIYLGRLSEEKGIFTLLRAMNTVIGARLFLIGTGPMEEKIKRYIEDSGPVLRDKIKMIGFLKGEPLKKVMKDAMFHVLPSECYENGPYSVLEMMAMGKATIASDIGGLRDYVEDKKTGLLFQAGNKEELAEYIQYLIDHRNYAMELGKNARSKVEKEHSKGSYYEKLLPIYETCVGDKITRIGMIGPKGIEVSLGGVERHVVEIGERLAKKFEITVYTRKKYGKEKSFHEKIQICPTASLPGKGIEAATYSLFASLKGSVSKNQLMHYHGPGAGLMSFIPKIFGKKVVVTVHGLDWKREKWGLLGKTYIKLGEKITTKTANHLIVVNRNLRDYYKEKYNNDVTYIPNGVGDMKSDEDNELEHMGFINKEYLLFLARLVPEKGCHFLLDAFTSLELSNINLVIAGGSTQTKKYEQKLKENYKRENIIFLGPVKGECVKQLYSNAILYILPSTVEGLPIGLLEAMSSGTCPLASDIEENLEVIKKDGLYGYTFRNGDVSDLANRIKELINDRDNLKEVGKRAREYALKNYEWNEVAKKTGEVYEKVLSESFTNKGGKHDNSK